jgi:hypothetical protein
MPTTYAKTTPQKRADRIAARIQRIDFCIERAENGPSSNKAKSLIANLTEEREARQAELKFMSFKAKSSARG